MPVHVGKANSLIIVLATTDTQPEPIAAAEPVAAAATEQ